RAQSALMMMDAYQPAGATLLTVDSIFMMPQLGILSTVLPEAATQVSETDFLIYLGTCVSPVGTAKEREPCGRITFQGNSESVPFGAIKVFPLGFKNGRDGEPLREEITVQPAKGFDVGEGKGRERKMTAAGGIVGLIIDARGRPLSIPTESSLRI